MQGTAKASERGHHTLKKERAPELPEPAAFAEAVETQFLRTFAALKEGAVPVPKNRARMETFAPELMSVGVAKPSSSVLGLPEFTCTSLDPVCPKKGGSPPKLKIVPVGFETLPATRVKRRTTISTVADAGVFPDLAVKLVR